MTTATLTLTIDEVRNLMARRDAGTPIRDLAREVEMSWQALVAEFKKVKKLAQADNGEVSESDLNRWMDDGGYIAPEPDEVEVTVPTPAPSGEVAPLDPPAGGPVAPAPQMEVKAKKVKKSKVQLLAEELGADRVTAFGTRWAAGEKLADLVEEAQAVSPLGHTLYYVLTQAGYFAGKAK